MSTTEPTDRQREVLEVIRRYWRDHGRPPTIRELGHVLGIGNPNGVVCHLKPLMRLGLIEWDRATEARSIWPAGLRQRIRDLMADTPTEDT